MDYPTSVTGHVVKAAEIGTIFGTPMSLREEAERIIRRAEHAGEMVQALAARERERLSSFLRDISDEELYKFIDAEKVKSAIASFSTVLDATAIMKRDFDSMQPWLAKLVESSVRRIIGELDDDDVLARIVSQALKEVDPGEHSHIRAGKVAYPKITEARRAYPDNFDGIQSIICDETLSANALYLECNVGLTEIGIETQIDALAQILSQPMSAPTK